MKNLFLLLLSAALLSSCATPKASITGIGYENGQATVTGTLSVTIPTQAQADSLISTYTKNVFTIKHSGDSANVHFYEWKFVSPVKK